MGRGGAAAFARSGEAMRHRFHALCPYFAMFPEQFVQKHLVWSEPGDLVFDPFSGRGTTVFESLLNGRRAAGCDTNPVAVCISNAKADPPSRQEVLERLSELEGAIDDGADPETEMEFFRCCYHPDTLRQLLHLRRSLSWRSRRDDRFIAAMALGALHGESHRSGRYFSNRMPRTISTKPAYSIRWWRERGYEPPRRDVFAILREILDFRMVSPPPDLRGRVIESDVRDGAAAFPELTGQVKLVITSPPYVDTTHYLEDQWLRLWFLGGDPWVPRGRPGDDRYSNLGDYWRFLNEAWTGVRPLLATPARLILRIGGRKLDHATCGSELEQSLEQGLGRSVRRVESHVSRIRGNQARAFRPGAAGCQVELDFHFLVQ